MTAAAERKLTRLVLCDMNSVSCAVEFIHRCREAGIQPILGIDFRKASGQSAFYGIAYNEEGFYELNAFLSSLSRQGKEAPTVAPPFQQAAVIYTKRPKAIEHFGEHEFLGIRAYNLHHLAASGLLAYPSKLLAYQPVCFLDSSSDFPLHQVLRAIDQSVLLSRLPTEVQAQPQDDFPWPHELQSAYAPYPFLLRNAAHLLSRCTIDLPCGSQNNRLHFSSSEADDFELLRKLAFAGCQKQYGQQHPTAFERLEKELQLIQKQGFCPYFLITWDMIRYASSAGFHHVGRGSGANSLVAYCLGITAVDPLALNLYFERFINEFRSAAPDFDIDFSWRERDEVIDYLFKRYGRDYVGLLATYNTFQGRSCLREIGKVYGLPSSEIDALLQKTAPSEADPLLTQIYQMAERLHGLPNYLSIHAGGLIISQRPLYYHTAFKYMPKGFPIVHFDMQHAEDLGFHKFDVLSQRGLGHIREAVELVEQTENKRVPIDQISAILADPAVLEGLRSASCIGCFYIESPAMRMLLSKLRCDSYQALVAASSVIRPGVAQSGMLREYISRSLAPHSFSYPHPIFETHLSETFGIMVYQEDVMRIAHHFAGLGLAQSDLLRRLMSGKSKAGDTLEKIREQYLTNCRERGYSETLSAAVWQQIESFAGYSFCKAHSASYAIESFQSLYLKVHHPHAFIVAVINNGGGFYPTEFYVHEARMQGACIQPPCVNHSEVSTRLIGSHIYLGLALIKSLAPAAAKKIIQIRQSLGAFTSLEDYLQKTSRWGDIPPNSDYDVPTKWTEAGFAELASAVSSLGWPVGQGQESLGSASAPPPYPPSASARETSLQGKVCDLLIQIGAFRFTGKSKADLYWEKNAWLAGRQFERPQASLFELSAPTFEVPTQPDGPYDQAFDEIALLGFPLRSPFNLLADDPSTYEPLARAADLKQLEGQHIRLLGYYVCHKTVRSSHDQLLQFSTWLDVDGYYFDGVHFAPTMASYPLRGPGIYLLIGKVVLDFEVPQLELNQVQRLAMRQDERWV